MSKKIIAIALFATMLLSLVTVANAAPDSITNIVATLDQPAAGAGVTQHKTGDVTFTTTGSNDNYVITMKADFDKLAKTNSKYNTSEDRLYELNFAITFDSGIVTGTNGNWFKVNGDTVAAADITTTGNTSVFTVDFYAERGGYSKEYVLTYNVPLTSGGETTASYKVTVKYVDSGSSSKYEKSMSFDPIANPYSNGNYNVYTLGGVMFIDYDSNMPLGGTNRNMPGAYYDRMGFRFYSDGNRIPASNKYAYVHGDTSRTDIASNANQFLYQSANSANPSYTNGPGTGFESKPNFFAAGGDSSISAQIKNDANLNLDFFLDPRITSMSITIEDEIYKYKSGTVNIVWRATPRNEITNTNLTIDSRNVSLVVGETKTMNIEASHASTYNHLRLIDTSYNAIVLCDGLKITGLRAGTTTLSVQITTDGGVTWKGVDSITVTITEPNVATAPVETTSQQYRVLASGNLNVRSGPGTSYPIISKVTQATILTVEEISNGWAKLANNGGYVSAQFIVAVNSSTTAGNFQVTASSLNVRSAPNGSVVGKLTKGSVVSVVGYSGTWAQLSTGSYVSSAYLKAI